MEFLEDGQVLKVKSVRLRDQGLYQCLASNNAGTQMRQFRLTVQGLYSLRHVPSTRSHICLNSACTLIYFLSTQKERKETKKTQILYKLSGC